MPRPWTVVLAALTATLLAGCGGGSPTGSGPTTAEGPQPPAPLPHRWHRHLDARDGLTIGVPHGWKVARRHGALFLTSPRRQVAISITVDRRGRSLAVPLRSYARAVPGALPGYRRPPRVTAVRPFSGSPLDGFRVAARGKAANGIAERISVIALRRDHRATFTIVVAAGRGARSHEVARAIAIARSLRDRRAAQA